MPRAESSRESIGSSSSRGNVSSIPSISINSNVGATKKIFVGGLHYETKDGTIGQLGYQLLYAHILTLGRLCSGLQEVFYALRQSGVGRSDVQ